MPMRSTVASLPSAATAAHSCGPRRESVAEIWSRRVSIVLAVARSERGARDAHEPGVAVGAKRAEARARPEGGAQPLVALELRRSLEELAQRMTRGRRPSRERCARRERPGRCARTRPPRSASPGRPCGRIASSDGRRPPSRLPACSRRKRSRPAPRRRSTAARCEEPFSGSPVHRRPKNACKSSEMHAECGRGGRSRPFLAPSCHST